MDLLPQDLDAPQLAAIAALLALLAYCWHTQQARGVIPNRVTAPAFVVASVAAPLFAGDDWPAHLAAAVATAIVLVLTALITDKIGLGAVKLLVVVAIVIGPAVWVVLAVTAAGTTVKSLIHKRLTGDSEVNPVPEIAGGVVIVAALATIV